MARIQGIVRTAEVGDVPAMREIYRPIVETTATSFELTVPSEVEFTRRLVDRDPLYPWLVFEAEARILGFAYASVFRSRPAYSTTCESTVYVLPESRRQGVAKDLMESLLALLAERGIHRVVAGISLPNQASLFFHESLGFLHVGTFHEVGWKFGRWHDVGFWEIGLEPPGG